MEVMQWNVTTDEEGSRIDQFVTRQGEDWSRSMVQQWIKEGQVLVNNKTVKSNYKLNAEDEIEVSVPEAVEPDILPENIPLQIVYEDTDVIVINKDRGIVVHPAPGHYSGTLVNALMYHCDDLSGINGEKRPGIVHRIDKDTTGLLVAAKHDKAHEQLSRQLQDKSMKREYAAIVHGVVEHDKGTIDAPIGRDERDRQKMKVTQRNAKEAVTHFDVLERFAHYTYIHCELETGRTHQIRVHMKYINHVIAGDPKYGKKNTLPIDGQALHAHTLSFIHPMTGERMTFKAPLPEEMESLLESLRKIT